MELHNFYVKLLKDPSRIFDFLKNGFLLLLSIRPIKTFPSHIVNDVVGVFDLLLIELTRQYDDSNQVITHDFKASTKVLNFFLISCSRHSTLTREQLDYLLHFIIRLAHYNFTMPIMINYWIETASKEPDSVFILYSNKSDSSYSPIYEITKDFLFMGDTLTLQSREVLAHIVLTTSSSKYLKDWILSSEFPSMIISGLLTTFNQACSNEQLLRNLSNSDTQTESLNNYREYLAFIVNLILCASEPTVQFLLLNSLYNGFISQVIEFYEANKSTIGSNILYLLCHAFINLLTSSPFPVSAVIANDLLEKYFNPEKEHNLQITFKQYFENSRSSTMCKAAFFDLLKCFVSSNSKNLTLILFKPITEEDYDCYDTSESSLNIRDLGVKVKELSDSYPDMKLTLLKRFDFMLTNTARPYMSRLSPNVKTPFDLDYSKIPSQLIFDHLLTYFENHSFLNKSLLDLLIGIAHYSGKDMRLFLSPKSKCKQVLDYNWNCNTLYLKQYYSLKSKSVKSTKLSSFEPIYKMNLDLLKRYKQLKNNNHQSSDGIVSPSSFKDNSEHFQHFVLTLYAIYETKILIDPTNK